MTEPVISVTGLPRHFGPTMALASVSLSLPRGAVYGLVGVNGAGKTTLIRHILDLLRADSGSVRVFGLWTQNVFVVLKLAALALLIDAGLLLTPSSGILPSHHRPAQEGQTPRRRRSP